MRNLCLRQSVCASCQTGHILLPSSACRTCGGLGVDKVTHPELLVPDPDRSILGGCFVREAFKYNPDTWDGRMMFSLAATIDFPLDAPWKQLPQKAKQAILYGIEPRKIVLRTPPDAKVRNDKGEGREVGFGGIARRIERHYRRYRQRGEANSRMEEWLDKVMVEHTCPDCQGARLRSTRQLFTIGGKTLYQVGQLNFDELHAFLGTVKPAGRAADAGRQVLKEIPYDRWRTYDPEDTVRFFALRLREAGMIRSTPQKIIATGTDWRFLNELKKELKG